MEYFLIVTTYAFRTISLDLCSYEMFCENNSKSFFQLEFKSWLENHECSQFPRLHRLCFDFIRFQFLVPTEINTIIIIYFYGNLNCQFR